VTTGGQVAVITDSTAYLPAGLAAARGVRVVPVHVVLAGRPGAEGVDVSPADVAATLARRGPVTTSRPSPAEFAMAYADAFSAGASGVVSIHLSGRMSGTVASARSAAADSAYDVEVVDSQTLCMGLGFAVLAAAAAAARGSSTAAVAQAAAATAAGTRTLFYVATLEHLRRGGRIGAAASRLGTALAVKPLLHVSAGEVALLEKVRTASRALARLEELAVEAAAGGPSTSRSIICRQPNLPRSWPAVFATGCRRLARCTCRRWARWWARTPVRACSASWCRAHDNRMTTA